MDQLKSWSWNYRMLPTACEIFEGLRGHISAMYWHYITVESTLNIISPLPSGLWPLCKPFWIMLLLCWPPLILLLLQLLVSSATALLGWLECLYSCYLPLQYRRCLVWLGSVTALLLLLPREWLSLQYIVAGATC